MSRSFRSFAAMLAVVFAGAACADAASPTAVTTDASASELRPGTQSIVEIAVGNPNFSTLVAAVVAADLVEALSADNQLTVFAPTDAAFGELGLNAENIADALTKDQLTAILTYHVAEGRRAANSVVNARQISTLNGGKLSVSRRDGGAFLNDSRIIGTDISARNGIVHVIDAVLLPPAN